MKRRKVILWIGMILCLAGCTRQVEKNPVIIQDAKAAIEPQTEQDTQTSEPSKVVTEDSSAAEVFSEKNTGEILAADHVKKELGNIMELDNVPGEFYLAETENGRDAVRKWKLRKCDGGYGFYYPVYEEKERKWRITPEEMISYSPFLLLENNKGMQIGLIVREASKEQDLKEMAGEWNEEVYWDPWRRSVLLDNEGKESMAEECVIGMYDYPAVRTDRLVISPPQNYEEDREYQIESTLQYYFVKCPEGILCILISGPADGEESWREVEKILDTLIIEKDSVYEGYHSAVSVNAKDKKLKFTSWEELHSFYGTCCVRGDYKSVAKISKNLPDMQGVKEAWESMECSLSGSLICMEKENRAVVMTLLTCTDWNAVGVKLEDEDASVIRYIYYIKEGDSWYVDGPLHNEEPSKDWWEGSEKIWNVENYGFSDSKDTGKIVASEKEIIDCFSQWEIKCEENSSKE